MDIKKPSEVCDSVSSPLAIFLAPHCIPDDAVNFLAPILNFLAPILNFLAPKLQNDAKHL